MPSTDVWAYFHSGSVLVIGAFIYSSNFPEKYFPAKFDYIGWSHNIFHVMVVISQGWQLIIGLRLYHDAKYFVCPLVPQVY